MALLLFLFTKYITVMIEEIYVEAELQTWCRRMVEKYNWLTIKYELSKKKGILLVSFYGDKLDDEEFNKDTLLFESELEDKYHDNSPLFCDNEVLFKLSSSAKILSNNR